MDPGGISATGCFWTIREGRQDAIMWIFHPGWDGAEGQPFFYQSHATGLGTGMGHQTASEGDTTEMVQEFWWSNGVHERTKHRTRKLDDDTHVGESLAWTDGEWCADREGGDLCLNGLTRQTPGESPEACGSTGPPSSERRTSRQMCRYNHRQERPSAAHSPVRRPTAHEGPADADPQLRPRPNRAFQSLGAVALPCPLLDSLPGLTDHGRSDPDDAEVPCATP